MDAESIEKIKRDTDLLQLAGVKLKKVASTGGGEWAGECPFCGGWQVPKRTHPPNRFRVQPKKGIWYCRICGDGRWNDAIEFVMRRDNLSFLDACKALAADDFSYPKVKINKMIIGTEKKLNEKDCDSPEWQASALSLIRDGIGFLWSDIGTGARKYLYERGLNDETLMKWGVGFIPKYDSKPCILTPCYDGGYQQGKIQHKKMRFSGGETRHYPGGREWLFGGFTYARGNIAFLVESRWDVMLADQTGINLGFAALPAKCKIERWYLKYFTIVEDLICIPDNDPNGAGIKGAQDKTRASRRWHIANYVPDGSDLTDYWKAAGDEALVEFILNQANIIVDGSPHEQLAG